jgi:hypothetical protein
MRKAFWCGAVGMIAGIAAVYGAAIYAERHPGSWFSHCLTKPVGESAVAAHTSSLIVNLGEAVASATGEVVPMTPRRSCKVECEAVAEECPNVCDNPPAVEATEPIQVTETDDGSTVSGCCHTPEESEAGSQPQPECGAVVPDEVVMPVCPEENNGSASMPYADEAKADDECSPFSTWFNWLRSPDKKPGMNEESDAIPQAEPQTPVMDPTYPPYPPGVDPVTPPGMPNCQMDPYHQHQYPGCPYMGGCPYGGSRCSPPPVQEPTTSKINKKKKKKKLKLTPASLLRKVKKGADAEELNAEERGVPGVDTMECRPSDLPAENKDPGEI